jgi:hypothetical protein
MKAFSSSIHSILSNDRSKASSKTVPPHSAIQSLLLQMTASSHPQGHLAAAHVLFLIFLPSIFPRTAHIYNISVLERDNPGKV